MCEADEVYIKKLEDEVIQLEAKLDDERDLRYKIQNETSKRIYELEAENKRLQKAAKLLYILTGEEYKKEGER